MPKTLLFIINPRAGRTRPNANAALFDAVARFCEAGYLVSVRLTAHQGHAAEIAAEEGASFDRVVCCGGDGTLNETVRGLMTRPSPPPTILPQAWASPAEPRRARSASSPAPDGGWTSGTSAAGPLSTWPPSGPSPGCPTARPSR